ncbi:MAG: dipeptidase [Proteobacteria bacterium]|nr:dipeptidase [Pseudomonadota bacterium]
MKRKGLMAAAVLAGLVGGFFLLAPAILENSMNRIDHKELIPVSAEARALHQTLQIVDLHSDTLLWQRDPLQNVGRGHEDLPRLAAGNVTLQLWSSVTKTPRHQNYDHNSAKGDNIWMLVVAQLQPLRTWTSLLERSLYHGQKLDRAVAGSGGQLAKVDSTGSLDALLAARAGGHGPVGAMLTVEGLHDLEGKAENLDRLYAAGFRVAGLAHFFDNDLAGSMHGEAKGGLTPFGRQIVRAMEAKGMVVDIAHCSHACVADVLAMARRPVISSHGGVQATCPVNRNLTDDEIRAVARTGGVIGIGYWDGAVCDTSPRATAKAMAHVRDLVGVDVLALGSDYDGTTTVRFDTSQLVQVTQALLDEHFTPDEIRKIMGGNALRVLRAGLVPKPELAG